MIPDYQHLYDTMIINPAKMDAVGLIIDHINKNKTIYEEVTAATSVPWYVTAVLHYREASFNFHSHLHNGDPLTARTTHVPVGRPTTGTPPFTWQESATDALIYQGLNKVKDWSIPNMLAKIERYNGVGYQKRGLLSPYLWSWCGYYVAGKYVADGKFNPTTVDQQCGCAVLLKLLL